MAEVVARARDAGVARMVAVGTDVPDSERVIALAHEFADLTATAGVHPHEARTLDGEALARLQALAADPAVTAIGEIGLDYHYDFSPRSVQREAFLAQLALARELDLPVVVHSREAEEDTLAILREAASEPLRGVVHCFPYGPAVAERCLELGLSIGMTGIVTFDKTGVAQEVARAVPLERLLLETDAPYLSPKPKRGQVNEPAYVVHVAAEVARLRGIEIAEVAAVTSAGAERLFWGGSGS